MCPCQINAAPQSRFWGPSNLSMLQNAQENVRFKFFLGCLANNLFYLLDELIRVFVLSAVRIIDVNGQGLKFKEVRPGSVGKLKVSLTGSIDGLAVFSQSLSTAPACPTAIAPLVQR